MLSSWRPPSWPGAVAPRRACKRSCRVPGPGRLALFFMHILEEDELQLLGFYLM